MSQKSKIEIPVKEATAAALADPRRLEAIGRIVDRLVRPDADDPLVAFFGRIAAETQEASLTKADIEAELAAHRSERRS